MSTRKALIAIQNCRGHWSKFWSSSYICWSFRRCINVFVPLAMIRSLPVTTAVRSGFRTTIVLVVHSPINKHTDWYPHWYTTVHILGSHAERCARLEITFKLNSSDIDKDGRASSEALWCDCAIGLGWFGARENMGVQTQQAELQIWKIYIWARGHSTPLVLLWFRFPFNSPILSRPFNVSGYDDTPPLDRKWYDRSDGTLPEQGKWRQEDNSMG